MKNALRVIAGTVPASLPGDGLSVIAERPGLRVEAASDLRLTTADGAQRVRAGSGQPGGAGGRFLDVTVGKDGVCEIQADPFGRRELYIETVAGATVMATTMDLLPIAETGGEMDQIALAHTLSVYGTRPPKRHTCYAGVKRLGVGQRVRIQNGRVELQDTPFTPPAAAPFGERELNQYADALLAAIEREGSTSGNVVYLSSGWDSTCILACLVHIFGKGAVRGVIGRMRYSERAGVINQFELDRAHAMAEYYGIPLDVVEFNYAAAGTDRLFEPWRPLFRAHQLASLVGLNHAWLGEGAVRLAGTDLPVFAGEISDGAHNLGFSQYVTVFHPVLAFREYSDKMASYLFGPTFLGLLANGQYQQDAVYQFLLGRQGAAIFDAPASGSDTTLQQLSTFFLRGNRFPLWSVRNSKFLTGTGGEAYRSHMESAYLADAAKACTPDTLYGWYLHLYNSFHWQGSTVAPLSLTAETLGLNAVLPFWDGCVQDILSAMPESGGRGLDLHHTKYPLKWMLQNRVDYPMHLQTGPHSYLYDVDPGFSHAAEMMYGSGLAPYFRSVLAKRQYRDVLSPDVFDLGYIDGMVTRYVKGEEVRGAELTDLTTLASLWMVGFYGAT
jgi:hypothetical protein